MEKYYRKRIVFNTKYPIVCVPMNQVSDIDLAIAVQKAGGVPSLSLFNFFKNNQFDFESYKNELIRYKKATDSDILLLSVGGPLLLNKQIIDLYCELGFKHIELYHWLRTERLWPHIMERVKELRDKNVNIIYKMSTGQLKEFESYENIILKGPDGAGRIVEDAMSLDDGFKYCKTNCKANLIPSGGIYSRQQVKDYLDNGAVAIGIGSLFAVSKESSISNDVKIKIINSTQNDLSLNGPLKHRGLLANLSDNDDINLTESLRRGIDDPNNGVIYIGKVIDYINDVLTVEQIIKNLAHD